MTSHIYVHTRRRAPDIQSDAKDNNILRSLSNNVPSEARTGTLDGRMVKEDAVRGGSPPGGIFLPHSLSSSYVHVSHSVLLRRRRQARKTSNAIAIYNFSKDDARIQRELSLGQTLLYTLPLHHIRSQSHIHQKPLALRLLVRRYPVGKQPSIFVPVFHA